ncbi:MAG TPA: PQQ-binding-like beta-propeller repeat protein [Candidatus Eisenbacteria bacterium]|nr:PQQ-binding-like beta-propeller repeat protein [Candidatus Eisenbacteria bacterium]
MTSLKSAALAVSLGAALVAASPQPTAITSGPRIHHRGDTERSGSYHGAPIRSRPRVLWTVDKGDLFLGTPLVDQGAIYSGASDGTLCAFDARTGKSLWTASGFDMIENATAIAGDVIVGGGMNGQVRALNRKTGEPIWSYSAGVFVTTPPLIVGDAVYVATHQGLHALDVGTGQRRWMTPLGTQPNFVGNPAAHKGVIVVSVGRELLAIDAATGAERWRVRSSSQFWSPALGEDRVFVGSSDGNLIAYDLATGAERWRFRSAYPTADDIWSAPAISKGVVYAGSRDAALYAVDATTGRKVWSFPTTGESVGDPVVSNEILYFSDSNHALPPGVRRLYALDASSGAEVWKYEVNSTLLTTPAVDQRTLYATITGQVMALTD